MQGLIGWRDAGATSVIYIHGPTNGTARFQSRRIPLQRGERSLAGDERSEPPDRINNDAHPGRGLPEFPAPLPGRVGHVGTGSRGSQKTLTPG